MKKFLKIFLVLVMTFMMSGSVLAKEVDHFKSDIDNSAEIKDDVKGSSAVLGDNASFSGKADGVSFLLGNSVSFTGESEYAALAGNSIEIEGTINNDAFIAGNVIDIDENASLKRDVIIAGADIEISGKIGRNVSIYGTNIKIKGAEIAGNVKIYGTNLNIDKNTVINGNLSYPSDAVANVNKEAIKGKVIKTEAISQEESLMTVVMGKFWSFMSLILVFAVLSLASSKIFVRIQKEYEKFDFNKALETFTKGLIFVIVLPIIIFALYFIIMYLSNVFAGYLLGYKLWQKFFDKDINMLVVGIFGLAILFILNLIPGINMIVSIISMMIGIGVIYDVILKKMGSND